MTNEELILHIRNDRSIQLEYREGKEIHTKLISIDTLYECIKNSLKGVGISTGILPEHAVCVTTDSESGQRYVTLEFPEEKAKIIYQQTEYPDFPIPRLLFGFRIESSGRISGVTLGVPALGKLTPDTTMYYYPFSNVSRFNMCIGANSLPHIKSLRQLSNLPYHILSLPDNDDHYAERNNRFGLGHRDLLEHLADKDRQYYYDHVLIPMPNTTLKDFL